MNGAWTFSRGDLSRQVAVKACLTSNSSVALREAALGGFGVACLPTYLVADDIVNGKLILVLPEFRAAISHTLYAMYYRSKYANALIRSFIDFIVAEIGEIPSWDRALQDPTGVSATDSA